MTNGVKWSAFADDTVRQIFPTEGAAGCKRFLLDRSLAAIAQRATRLKVLGASAGWGLPEQDGAADHRLWQGTAVPVYNTSDLKARI